MDEAINILGRVSFSGGIMEVKLLQITPFSEELIERSAREAYDSVDKMKGINRKFLKGIIDSGHESVLEHAVATFRISGVSRALTHQLVRHRLASYTQRSQRYVNENYATYVTPPSIAKNSAAQEEYITIMGEMIASYAELVEMYGIPKEDARYVLPNAICTSLVTTANFREWRHILKLRLNKHAQWEIRELMARIRMILAENAPTIFEGVD